MRAHQALAIGGAAMILLVSPGPGAAQLGRVHLSGEVEQNITLDTLTVGKEKLRTFSLGNRYAPALDGFIWDPRFLTYFLSGTFSEQRTDLTTGETRSLTLEPYRFIFTAFPQAVHSFGVRGSRSKTEFTTDGSTLSSTTETLGGSWNYRGSALLPETTLDLGRETVESELVEGVSDTTRSTLSLRLRKQFDRFQPTFNYIAEQTDQGGTVKTLETEGLSHRVQYEDRVRVGQQALLTPLFDYEVRPESQAGNGNLTLTGPLSPTLDGSTGVRYAFFERGNVATHTVTGNGQLLKRFTPDLALTTAVNGAFGTGGGPDTWNGGGLVSLSALPFTHLRTTSDYALQVSGGTFTTILHRGHLNAVSTILPRHTFTTDYFLTVSDTSGGQTSFVSHSGTLGVASQIIPLTTLSATYALDLQEGAGERERQSWRLGADVTPYPWVSGRASGEYFTEQSSGGGRTPIDETGLLTEAGVVLRVLGWLEFSLTGRHGVKDVVREDRTGQLVIQGLTAAASVDLGTLLFRGEGFVERDDDARQDRQGVRGSFSYRFRVWTLTGDFEVSNLKAQTVDIRRDRILLRLSRPLDFTLY